MEISKTKVIVYILTFLGYAFSGYGSGIIENFRDGIVLAEEFFGHFLKDAVHIMQKLGEALRVINASDDNCVFSCPSGGTPVKNKYYKPSYNGCGASLTSLKITDDITINGIKECCNQYNVCYDTCNNLKKDCDDKFKECLYKVRNKLTKVEPLNKVETSLIFGLLSLSCQSYLESQRRSCYCPRDGNNNKKKFTPGGEL